VAEYGKFEGRTAITFLPDGRRVKTIEPFSFIDPRSLRWDVPAGAIVDGASIPRVLWTLIGGPWEGKYRDASVIHDWYCDLRSRSWESTHIAFYEAMCASNVPAKMAKLLYAGVQVGGPRWSKTVQANVELNLIAYQPGEQRQQQQQQQQQQRQESSTTLVPGFRVSTLRLTKKTVERFERLIENTDPDIEAITEIAEKERNDFALKHPDVEVTKFVADEKR
jgi:hypothetical protein